MTFAKTPQSPKQCWGLFFAGCPGVPSKDVLMVHNYSAYSSICWFTVALQDCLVP